MLSDSMKNVQSSLKSHSFWVTLYSKHSGSVECAGSVECVETVECLGNVKCVGSVDCVGSLKCGLCGECVVSVW